MVSNPEEITTYSPSLPMTQTTVKKPSASKSLCFFINIFDVKKITAIRRVGAAKSKRRSTNLVIASGTIKQNKKGIQK